MIELKLIRKLDGQKHKAGLPIEKELCKLIVDTAKKNGFSGEIRIKFTNCPWAYVIKSDGRDAK